VADLAVPLNRNTLSPERRSHHTGLAIASVPRGGLDAVMGLRLELAGGVAVPQSNGE
jgi:hypothetical protein